MAASFHIILLVDDKNVLWRFHLRCTISLLSPGVLWRAWSGTLRQAATRLRYYLQIKWKCYICQNFCS